MNNQKLRLKHCLFTDTQGVSLYPDVKDGDPKFLGVGAVVYLSPSVDSPTDRYVITDIQHIDYDLDERSPIATVEKLPKYAFILDPYVDPTF